MIEGPSETFLSFSLFGVGCTKLNLVLLRPAISYFSLGLEGFLYSCMKLSGRPNLAMDA
jgi:hypothetical protein